MSNNEGLPKINYSFSRIIIILGVWEVGIDGCPLLPIL
jgi:hypothetical protein